MGIAYMTAGTQFTMDDERHELTRKVTDHVWKVTNLRTERCKEMTDGELMRRFSAGEITLRGFPGQNLRAYPERSSLEMLEQVPERYHAVVLERLYYVQAVRRANLDARTEEWMNPVIQEVYDGLTQRVIKNRPHWSTVWRWIKLYEDAGRDIAGLIPGHRRKGRKRLEVPQELYIVIHELVHGYYLTRERPSKNKTLERINTRIDRENKIRPVGAVLPYAKRWMVDRVLKDTTTAFDRCAARYGREKARAKYRAVLHRCTAERPLERVQMDHAQLNVFCMDERTLLPRGRPWITVAVDVATRCVLGVHISFNPPGHMSVARCLRHAVLPKVGLKEKFPKLINSWDCHGAMESLTVDNGQEFHGHALEAMAGYLGIDIEFMPRRTPWFKGMVERWFGTLDQDLIAGTPGQTFRSIAERGDYDPEKHAVVTMPVLEELVTRWIVDVYHQTVHSGIGKTPAQAWRDLEHTIEIGLPINAEDLDPRLGKRDWRRLDHRGVTYAYLWYNSEELAAMRIRHGDQLKVEIVYDSEDLGSVFVFDPETKEPVEVPALDHDYANGLSERQHKWIRQEALKRGKSSTDTTVLREVKEQLRELIREEYDKKQRAKRKRGRATWKADMADAGASDGDRQATSGQPSSRQQKSQHAKAKGKAAQTAARKGAEGGARDNEVAESRPQRQRGTFASTSMPVQRRGPESASSSSHGGSNHG